MVEMALIQQCADPALTPAIVERFIAAAGSADPLAVMVRSGDRVILVPQAKTADEAMAIIRDHVGRAVVRVGITQYPAGLGVADVSELGPDLVDACENIRIGTALFGKVYRIVTKWYGNAVDEALDDAIYAWKTGYFEGKAIFSEPDPGDGDVAMPAAGPSSAEGNDAAESAPTDMVRGQAGAADPNQAGIRIDLSGIGGRAP